MIKLKMSIEDISEYQTGILPKSAVKIETPQSIEEMMKKAAPIAAVLCVLMFVTMLCKTVMNKTVVISHVFILIGFQRNSYRSAHGRTGGHFPFSSRFCLLSDRKKKSRSRCRLSGESR